MASQAAFSGFGSGMATGAKLARNLFEITGKGRRVPVFERIKVLGTLIKSMAGQTTFVARQAEMRRVRKDGQRMFDGCQARAQPIDAAPPIRIGVDAECVLFPLSQKLSEELRLYLSVFVRVCHGPETDDGGIRPQEAHLPVLHEPDHQKGPHLCRPGP